MEILFKDEIILKTENFTVWQDREVPIPGFFILAPNRKIRTIDEFSEKEAIEFIKILSKVRKWMKDVLNINDVYFFQNEDTVNNFHFRIFPRYNRMEKFWNKIQSVRPIMERAIGNMIDEKTFIEVKDYVKKMKVYLETF